MGGRKGGKVEVVGKSWGGKMGKVGKWWVDKVRRFWFFSRVGDAG